MFREMRRKNQQLSKEETMRILDSCTSGVLGVHGDDGYPYTVPVSYALEGDKIFIHSAIEGHKIDSISRCDKVSFCVIERDDVVQKTFTTHYRSAVIFGRARILTDEAEKRHALECLVEKYSPDYIKEGQQEMERAWDRVCLIEIRIERMTGKAAKEIVTNDN
jgi:nitroimidazol reductase NimA-like FMN-containing flavoprotein (pyridoxamine 5'-phosphate oxidase superfamily)